MTVIEYIDDGSHNPLHRDRDNSLVPQTGVLVRLPSGKVWEVVGHMFDYETNAPDLWVCVIVKPRK